MSLICDHKANVGLTPRYPPQVEFPRHLHWTGNFTCQFVIIVQRIPPSSLVTTIQMKFDESYYFRNFLTNETQCSFFTQPVVVLTPIPHSQVVVVVVIAQQLDLQLAISTQHHYRCEFESDAGGVYYIAHFVINFVSDLQHVGGFLSEYSDDLQQ